jgi:hypothetical protein
MRASPSFSLGDLRHRKAISANFPRITQEIEGSTKQAKINKDSLEAIAMPMGDK